MPPPALGCAPCAARDEEIAQLREQLAARDAEVTGLREQIAAQDGQLAELKDRISPPGAGRVPQQRQLLDAALR